MKSRKLKSKDVFILYEDNHLIAIDKPTGVLVYGDDSYDESALDVLKEYIKKEYNKQGNVFLSPTHRIDRPVSGVMIYAKTSKALARMNTLFRKREVSKKYYAIVNKIPENLEGTLIHWIKKDRNKNISRSYITEVRDSKRAELLYKYMSGLNGYHLLRIRPITGRAHQIRVQLSAIGLPIVGDLKYGYNVPNQDRSICLHCSNISFIHPVKKTLVSISAKIPHGQIWNLFLDTF